MLKLDRKDLNKIHCRICHFMNIWLETDIPYLLAHTEFQMGQDRKIRLKGEFPSSKCLM